MASVDLVKSTKMNEDYQSQAGLQKQLGTLTTLVNEIYISNLHREKKERRKISQDRDNTPTSK